MTITTKRVVILFIVIFVAVVLGRLAVRAVLNILLGGTMFGGNLLWKKKEKEEKECLYLYLYVY